MSDQKEHNTSAEEQDQIVTENTAGKQPDGPNIQEIAQQLAAQGRKLIQFIPPLSETSQKTLIQAQEKLDTLTEKIVAIQKEVNDQNDTIKTRVQPLKDSGMLNIQADFGSADESIAQYSTLLKQIIQEINKEHAIVSDYLGLEKQTLLPVSMREPDSFEAYVHNKASNIRKQARKIEKDLHVSFSRYQFSFSNHMKRIENLEQFVAYNKMVQAAQEKASEKQEASEANSES